MNLTSTFLTISLCTLVLLAGTACTSTQSAVKDLPPPPTPPPTPIAKVSNEPTPTPSLPADELITRTSPLEALRQFKAGLAILVDVRDKASFETMRIKGATLLTFQDVMSGKLGNLPKNKHLIFYCTCIREHSAAQAAVVFQQKGYQQVSALKDGLIGYQQAGGEIEMKN